MTAAGDLDRGRISALHATELAVFRQARPRSLAMVSRARAHMPNGVPMAWMATDNDQPVYIALEPGDVALVLTEPAMTNGIHMLLPEPGWHDSLRDLTRQHGTLLALCPPHARTWPAT